MWALGFIALVAFGQAHDVAAPLLPNAGRQFPPSMLESQGEGPLKGDLFRDASACGACHPDAFAQWQASAHAFSSFNNPLYRVAVERLQAERGFAASRACGGCHDVALLQEGAMDGPVAPEDARAHAGIVCQTCHSASHSNADGNGSLKLSTQGLLPASESPADIAEHRKRTRPSALTDAALCGACHRSFLDESTGNASAFFGMDDYSPWLKSAYAGSMAERVDWPVARQDCRGCHMPSVPAPLGDVAAKGGRMAGHRFAGAQTHLAAMRGDSDQLHAVQKVLKDAVTVDVPNLWVDGQQAAANAVRAGAQLRWDVVLFNEKVGHRFPGGVMDNQGTLLSVKVFSARGEALASSDEHALRSFVVDARGNELSQRQTHQFITAVWNHTLAPREARAVRYSWRVPPSVVAADFPLRLQVQLKHRARLAPLEREACSDSMSERGLLFAQASQSFGGGPIDGCVSAPWLTVSQSTLEWGPSVGTPAANSLPEWERQVRHGLALLTGFQESLVEALPVLERAYQLAAAHGELAKARTSFALGLLASKQGRADDAMGWFARAQAHRGAPAALAKARGDALSQVWRWKQAAAEYELAAALAPNDVEVLRSLAMAQASLGNAAEALRAAQAGLVIQPRDPDCLRVQALTLQQLGAPETVTSLALEQALHWRSSDEAPSAKAACSRNQTGCAQRRNPVPEYSLTAPLP